MGAYLNPPPSLERGQIHLWYFLHSDKGDKLSRSVKASQVDCRNIIINNNGQSNKNTSTSLRGAVMVGSGGLICGCTINTFISHLFGDFWGLSSLYPQIFRSPSHPSNAARCNARQFFTKRDFWFLPLYVHYFHYSLRIYLMMRGSSPPPVDERSYALTPNTILHPNLLHTAARYIIRSNCFSTLLSHSNSYILTMDSNRPSWVPIMRGHSFYSYTVYGSILPPQIPVTQL